MNRICLNFQEIDRSAYTGVRARWYDMDGARGHLALAGKNGHVKILRGDFSTEAEANAPPKPNWRV